MFRLSVSVPIFLSLGLLAAQRAPVEGPVEGFTFDAPTKSFRTISGALGAAFLGPALLRDLDFGSVAPRGDYGIAFQSGQGLVVSGIGSEQQTSAALPGSFSAPEGVIWSGDGAIAVLYSRTENWFQVVAGFPGSVVVSPSVSVATWGGSLATVSADLHGEHIFVGVTGNSAGVYQVTGDASPVLVLPLAKPVAMAVSEDRKALYVLDGDGNQLYELSLADLSSQSWPMNGLEDPVALEPSRDARGRQVLYAAGRGDQALVTYDAGTHEIIATLPLDFQPIVIESLGQHSFVLRNRVNDGEPMWTFTDGAEPAVYFVPASPLAASGGAQ